MENYKVSVKCPVYKNGRKCYGVVILTGEIRSKVKIEGNSKSTTFANVWIKKENN